MKFKVKDFPDQLMWIVCMMKVYHDAGIDHLEKYYADDCLDTDYFYEFVIEGLDCAAPIIKESDGLYQKYGYDEFDDVNIRAYSSEEMKKCFYLARKLDRLDGDSKQKNEHEQLLISQIDDLRGFMSYSFDWAIGSKRRGAQLEVLWGYEFMEEVALCMWIVRTMELFKVELPKLQEKYRKARRKKRAMKSVKSGGILCAAE